MPKPVLQSLILADHVYEDKLTGKRIIAGIFNRIIRGVRVVRQVGPPMPMPPQPAAPQYFPPPPQPAAPPPPEYSADDFSAPPQYASPNMPAAPQAPPPPAAPAAPASYPPAAPSYPSAQPATPASGDQPPPAAPPTPTPAPYRHPEVPAPEYTPAAHTPPAHQPPPLPPIVPGQLQPGQRVLEIPPTGLQSGSPFAYLSLTELRGAMSFCLQLVNLEDDSQLFRSDLRVECHNPLLTVEVTVPLPPISPPQAGIYALELLWNNEILGSLRIIVEDAVQQ
jgi:hypothetical protein